MPLKPLLRFYSLQLNCMLVGWETLTLTFLNLNLALTRKKPLELTQSFSLLPAVDKPTRVYGNSATLIDNIFSNNLENSLICGNIVTDATDHFTQVCIVSTHPNSLNYSKQRKKSVTTPISMLTGFSLNCKK